MKSDSANKPRRERMTRAAKIVVLIGALIGALLFWLYAIGYDNTEFERTFAGVEVTVEGAEELASLKGFSLADEQYFSSITIVAKGKRSELNALDVSDFRAVVDLSMAERAGEQTLNIVVYSPNGIEVVSQSSDTVTVFVDEFTQRNDLLSVSVETGSNYVMSEGVTFVEAVANPLSILVSGPKSELDKIQGAYVKFDLDGVEIKDNIYGYGAIELRDKNGNVIQNPYITVSDRTAYVSISVIKQKTIPVRVSFIGGIFNPSEVAVTQSASSITVSGRPEVIDSVTELVLEIDESTIEDRADFAFSIGSLLPEGVSNESGSSKINVTVALPEMSVRTYNIPKESISVINLPDGAECIVTNGVSVKVIGPREAFDNIDPKLITAVADFDRMTVMPDGTYSAKISVSLGEGVSGVYVQNIDYYITFELRVPKPANE